MYHSMRLQSIHRQALVFVTIVSFLWIFQKVLEALEFGEEALDDKNIKARSNKRQKSGSNKIRGSKASQGFELRRGSGSRGSKNKEQEYGIRIQQNPKIPKNTRIQCPDQAKKEDQDLAKSKILLACVRVVFFVVKVVHN